MFFVGKNSSNKILRRPGPTHAERVGRARAFGSVGPARADARRSWLVVAQVSEPGFSASSWPEPAQRLGCFVFSGNTAAGRRCRRRRRLTCRVHCGRPARCARVGRCRRWSRIDCRGRVHRAAARLGACAVRVDEGRDGADDVPLGLLRVAEKVGMRTWDNSRCDSTANLL